MESFFQYLIEGAAPFLRFLIAFDLQIVVVLRKVKGGKNGDFERVCRVCTGSNLAHPRINIFGKFPDVGLLDGRLNNQRITLIVNLHFDCA